MERAPVGPACSWAGPLRWERAQNPVLWMRGVEVTEAKFKVWLVLVCTL